MGYNEKVTSDKKTLFISDQRYKGGNRDYCSHFSLIFETTNKFPIVLLRYLFGKVELPEFPGHDGKLTSDVNLI